MKYKTVKILIIVTLTSAACCLSAYSQILTYGCASDENISCVQSDNPGKNTPLFPVSGSNRVLVIYCKFIDDYFDYPPYTDLWPGNLNTLPSWTINTVAGSEQMHSPHPSITGYFEDMSMGKLKVTGDVCPVLIVPRLPSYYYSKNAGSNISYLTKEVLDKADPFVNFSDYDHYDPNDYNRNGIYNEPDGTADMIIICFRLIPIGIGALDDLGGYSGVASLTGGQPKFPGEQTEIIKDGIKIKAGIRGSGTFQHSIVDPHGQLHIIAHEIGHYLFSGTIGHLPGTGYYTLMSGIGCGVMSAFEREQLGWIQPKEVKGNTINAALPDVISSGIAYKIPVANPPFNYPLHLYVENFQSQSFYVREWLTGYSGVKTIQNYGILISEANSNVFLSEVKCADGKWNWDKRKFIWHFPWIIKDWLYTYPFKHIAPNPDSGDNEMQLIGLRYDKNDYTLTIDHPDVLGDADDFYNLDYNDVYSAWSNPNTFPYSSANVCIELTGKVYKTIYANFYLGGNSPVEAKPSKPQLWKIENNNGFNPKITWMQGREPDLAGFYVYRKTSLNASWENIAEIDKTDFEYTDPRPAGDTVFYKIRSFDTQGKFSVYSEVVSSGDGKPEIPEPRSPYSFALLQNYPNPFNPVTSINVILQGFSYINLTVFDITGREVGVIFKGYLSEGLHKFIWDGSQYPSGVYFYRLEAGVYSFSRKMILVK